MNNLNDLAIFNADYKKWSIIEKNLKFDEIRKKIVLEKKKECTRLPRVKKVADMYKRILRKTFYKGIVVRGLQ